jgi:hypothetical protein
MKKAKNKWALQGADCGNFSNIDDITSPHSICHVYNYTEFIMVLTHTLAAVLQT